MGGDYEPLKPVYYTQPPPYYSRYTGRVYKGRKDWWNELGYKNEDESNGIWKGVHYQVREFDQDWYDPKVADGTSMVTAEGKDSRFYKDTSKKFDTPGNLFEYQEKLMKNSEQYKNIAEKYNLSKEHPGLAVSPNLSQLSYTPKSYLGLDNGFVYGKSFLTWGPRFFDKPMNEGCFTKGAALVKYTLMLNALYSGMQFMAEPKKMENLRLGRFFRIYAKNAPVPCVLAMAYGVSICTAANIRNVDDIYNPMIAGPLTGLCLTSIKGRVPSGFVLGAALTAMGIVIHYSRITRFGLQGQTQNTMLGGFWGLGPLQHQAHETGQIKVPTVPF